MSNRKSSLSNILYILKLVFQANPFHIFIEIGIAIFARVFNVFFFIYMIKYIYTIVEKNLPFKNVVVMVTLGSLGHITLHIISAVHNYYYVYKTEPKIFGHIYGMVIDKAAEVELKKYDEPDFYDSYTRALEETKTRTNDVIRNISNILGNIAAAISTLLIIVSIDPYVIVFSIIPLFNMFYLGKKRNKLYYDMDMESTYHNRRTEYVKRVFYENKYAKELKITNIKSVLLDHHQESFQKIISITKKYLKKIIGISLIDEFIMQILVHTGAALYITYKITVLGLIALGDYVALLSAVNSLTYDIYSFFNNLMNFNKQSLYIENIRSFLEYEPEIKYDSPECIPISSFGRLEIKDVSFSYNDADKPVLQNINIVINRGEKIALVGHNGAGKTTLIKLITRLYQASSGAIKLNGIDINKFNKDYTKMFATVFQDFKIFALTVAENVLMDKVENDDDRRSVQKALSQADAKSLLTNAQKGVDTQVTKEFDETGIVFSGGQQQKLALSRVYARESQIVILDEPSSALDPIAEREMYDRMMDVSDGKTVILISHRLASTQSADKIFVLEEGEIIEQGDHETLMAQGGKYCEMYLKQAENYR